MYWTKRSRSLAVDLLFVAIATTIALALRENFVFAGTRWAMFAGYLLITVAVAGPVLLVFQVDRPIWRFSGLADYLRAAAASALIVIGAVAVGFTVNRLDGVARSLPILQVILMAVGLVGARVLARIIHRRRRVRAHGEPISLPAASDTVLLIGWSSVAELYIRSVEEIGNGKIHVAGILSSDERQVGRVVLSTKVLGTPEDVRSVLANLDIHGVSVGRLVVAVPFAHLSDDAQKTLREIESTTDVRLEFFVDRLVREPVGQVRRAEPVRAVHQMPQPGPFALDSAEVEDLLRTPYWMLKRAFDTLFAFVVVILLLPLGVVVAVLVALDVGLPVLFVQQRPGRRGVRFNLYKFRTMGPACDRSGNVIAEDARVSRVGAFLRRTRLDELPQLYNILVGDMSFIGPRPLVTREQSSETMARLYVRPGLTGWAQVRGGRVMSIADKTALDLWYVRHASFGLDLKILAATVLVVLFGERVDRSAVRTAWRDLRSLAPDNGPGDRRRAA